MPTSTLHLCRSLLAVATLALTGIDTCSSRAVADEPRKWPVEIKVGQFLIHSDFELPDPRQLGDELHQLSADLNEMLPGMVHDEAVHIVIFQQRDSYQKYMQHYFPTVPQRPAIFLRDRGPGMLFTHWHAEVIIDLRHEATHALLSRRDRQLPLWLDEGLAEYFEVPRDARFSGHPYLALVQQTLAGPSTDGRPLPDSLQQTDRAITAAFKPPLTAPRLSLESLEAINKLDAFKEEHYVAAWMWIHFLLHRHPQTRQLVLDNLRRHASGESTLQLSRLLTEVIDQPTRELATHFRELRPSKPNQPGPT